MLISGSRTIDADQIVAALIRHPRVAYQSLIADGAAADRLRETAVPLLAFDRATYSGVLAVLDWDHRLPSVSSSLRVYVYYSERNLRRGETELQMRTEAIRDRDRFPEFDVPDYADLQADEAYEADVELDGTASKMRLVSAWRREIANDRAKKCISITRSSAQFRQLHAETRNQRPDQLGDLEAVGWAPPCETSLTGWTIDVWYLTHLDNATGRGHSFLVDLGEGRVVGTREFVVRAA